MARMAYMIPRTFRTGVACSWWYTVHHVSGWLLLSLFQKKRGHGKSGGKRKGPKISLAKLSNKRLNKLSKQGKLKRRVPKAKLMQLIKERTNPSHERELLEPDGVEEKEEQDIPLVEADYEYFATPGRDFSFLSDVGPRYMICCV